jgi:hypothetical protein
MTPTLPLPVNPAFTPDFPVVRRVRRIRLNLPDGALPPFHAWRP